MIPDEPEEPSEEKKGGSDAIVEVVPGKSIFRQNDNKSLDEQSQNDARTVDC